MMRRLQTRYDVLVVLLLSVAFLYRVVLILTVPGSYDGSPHRQDGYVYDSLAWHLLTGKGFAVNRASVLSAGDCPPCEPITYPLPGYPLFLAGLYALFGRSYLVVKLVQAAVDTATACMAYRLAGRVTDSQRTAILVLGVVALNPFTALWTTDLSTETLATFFATSIVWFALQSAQSPWRLWWYLGFGVTAGLGTLVRPAFVLLPVVLLSAIWLARSLAWREALLRSALVLTAAALCLLPWVVRNYLVFHQVIFAGRSNAPEQDHGFGYYAWYQNWLRDPTWTPRVNWDYMVYARETIPDHPFPDYAYDSEGERQEVEQLMQQVKAAGRFTPEIEQRFALLARAKAQQYPVRRYVVLPLVRMARVWINSGTSAINDPRVKGGFSLERVRAEPIGFVVRVLLSISYCSIAPLGLVGMWLLRRRYWVIVPAALSVAYHTLIMEAIGYGVRARYVVYSVPVMLVFVGVSLVVIWDRIRLLWHAASRAGTSDEKRMGNIKDRGRQIVGRRLGKKGGSNCSRRGLGNLEAGRHFIGDCIARVVLSLFYFTLFVPYGVGARLFGDPLDMKAKAKPSWWLERTTRDLALDDARRQS
jgi:4-amino-4-deoxy-L-arabinose transferase-like glycosyltransferase